MALKTVVTVPEAFKITGAALEKTSLLGKRQVVTSPQETAVECLGPKYESPRTQGSNPCFDILLVVTLGGISTDLSCS